MWNASANTLSDTPRGNWVRIRTLILLRWMAIIGQALAVLSATQLLRLDLRLDLCGLAIGASVVFNLIATLVNPESKRLSEQGTMLMLLFDVAQLAVLLYLTGGLGNPFAVLMLAPVTIAATALSLRPTVLVGFAAITVLSVLAFYHMPLRTVEGDILAPPELFIFGTWVALVIGILFVGGYARRVTSETFSVSQALLATQMALGREQQLTALGGVVAATAHELGTPLATIKLASAELIEELGDQPELVKDARLIHAQADRCRDILQNMGRAGKDDLLLRTAPLLSLIELAAEPHRGRGIDIVFRVNGVRADQWEETQPLVQHQPEIIHGLRNLIQNAVDFAVSTVWIDIEFGTQAIRVVVGDDGAGIPPELLGRMGEPFLRHRAETEKPSPERPEYEGMGLGLFIAKTLLERSGAELTFANGSVAASAAAPGTVDRPTGAIVEVRWPRARIEVPKAETRAALGANTQVGG